MSRIRIVYPCGNTPGLSGSVEYKAWWEKLTQAFAAIGWRVDSQGPTMSSTNVDEDELNLASEQGPLERAELVAALRHVGFDYWHYWSGDVVENGVPVDH